MASAEYIASIVSLVVFYGIIILVGILSSIWFKRRHKIDDKDFDLQIVAGRKLSGVVGWLTMTATLVGGGFLNGTAEGVARDGLAWTLAPFGICLGLIIGGVVFAPAMRRRSYKTMLDPLEEKYGPDVTGVIYLTSLFGDILWSASILAALGTTVGLIVGLSTFISVIVSAVVAVFYTLIGQMVSVAYTDVAELILIVLGMTIATPFAFTHKDVSQSVFDSVNTNETIPWLGQIDPEMAGFWADLAIAMTLGSIPWQSYFQRVLSVDTVGHSRSLSILAGFSAVVLAVPPVCLGVIGASVDWNNTEVSEELYLDKRLILPLVIKTYTPVPVSVLGLGAIAAAVMSSIDSAVLGSSSMFTNHVYRRLRNLMLCSSCHTSSTNRCVACINKPSNLELSIVLKICIIVIGAVSALVALCTPSQTIYGLFILAADVVFVATLPQLICTLYIPVCNGYGGLTGYLLSLILRFGAGEPIINLPSLIKFPYYSDDLNLQLFPFRTFSMLCAILTTVVVSLITQFALARVHHRFDVLKLVHNHWKVRMKPAAQEKDEGQEPEPECHTFTSMSFQEF